MALRGVSSIMGIAKPAKAASMTLSMEGYKEV
jgi:hypothetical protein